MPFKSEAQRRKFFAMASRGEISEGTLGEWEEATPKDEELPEKVDQEKESGVRQLTDEDIKRFQLRFKELRKPGTEAVIDEEGGVLRGVASRDMNTRELTRLWVAPGHRRLGVGSALLDAVGPVERLRLLSSNKRARNFYKAHGFDVTGPAPGNYGDRPRSLQMEKVAKQVRVGPPPKRNRKEWPYQGTISFRGLDIMVENKRGSYREWTDPTGKKGRTKMVHHYGEVRRTLGPDGDPVDVFVGPDADSDVVYVVHQMKAPKFKVYDEDKCMLGFRTAKEAKAAYLKHYDTPKFFGSMTTMSLEDFRKLLRRRDVRGKRITEALIKVGAQLFFPSVKTAASRLRSAVEIVETMPGALSMRLGGREVGNIATRATPSRGGQVGHVMVDPALQGMGLGKKLYGELARRVGGPLTSDSVEVTRDAARVWEGMPRRGYVLKFNPEGWEQSPGIVIGGQRLGHGHWSPTGGAGSAGPLFTAELPRAAWLKTAAARSETVLGGSPENAPTTGSISGNQLNKLAAKGIPDRGKRTDPPALDTPRTMEFVTQLHHAKKAGCFPEGAPVDLASGGQAAMECVPAGAKVRTRGGVARVNRLWDNGPASHWVLVTASGMEVCCTPPHEVWVAGSGWTPILALTGVQCWVDEQGEVHAQEEDLPYLQGRVRALRCEDSDLWSELWHALGPPAQWPERYSSPSGRAADTQRAGSTTARPAEARRLVRDAGRPSVAEGEVLERAAVPGGDRAVGGVQSNRRDSGAGPAGNSEANPSAESCTGGREDARGEASQLEGGSLQRPRDGGGRPVQPGEATQGAREEAWSSVRVVRGDASRGDAPRDPVPLLSGQQRREPAAPVLEVSRQGGQPVPHPSWRVLRIRRLAWSPRRRLDLEVEGTHCYYVDGLLVHNSHIDLRIGDTKSGIAHSWALPKVLVPQPGERVLAIQQPDHSIRYMDFRGLIGRGYGAGTVKAMDRLQTEVHHSEPGKLKFRLDRGRGEEEFVLRRTGKHDRSTKWLLQNVTKTASLEKTAEVGPLARARARYARETNYADALEKHASSSSESILETVRQRVKLAAAASPVIPTLRHLDMADELLTRASLQQGDWVTFQQRLQRSPGYRQAVLLHPRADAKLKRHVRAMGALHEGTHLKKVQSLSGPSKYQLKLMSSGRLGCTCPDWRYRKSHGGGDCKHVRAFRSAYDAGEMPRGYKGLQNALEKASAVVAANVIKQSLDDLPRLLRSAVKNYPQQTIRSAEVVAQAPAWVKALMPQGLRRQVGSAGWTADVMTKGVPSPGELIGKNIRKAFDKRQAASLRQAYSRAMVKNPESVIPGSIRQMGF